MQVDFTTEEARELLNTVREARERFPDKFVGMSDSEVARWLLRWASGDSREEVQHG